MDISEEQLDDLIKEAFKEGFSISGEGYNAEYANGNNPDLNVIMQEEELTINQLIINIKNKLKNGK